MGKVAFLALTYSSFEKEGLMKKFFNLEDRNLYNLYIHNKTEITDEYFRQFCISTDYKVDTEWGKYSLVLATIRLLMVALQDPQNKKFVLISGSHCPLYNMRDVCRKIEEDYEFLSFSRGDDKNSEFFSTRRFNSLLCQQKSKFCPLSPKDAMFVSQWFVCNRSDAELLVKSESKFRKWIEQNRENCSDEIYFPLIANHLGIKNQIKKVCYWNWFWKTNTNLVDSGHRLHPHSYSKVKDNFIKTLRDTTDCLFFRKVFKDTVVNEDLLMSDHNSFRAKNKYLVFSSVGDSCEAYKSWFALDRDYDIAIAYYGDDEHVFAEIQKHSDFCFKNKGAKFPNFLKLKCKLDYDYVLILDDDIEFFPTQLSNSFDFLNKNKIHVAGPSQNPSGKISWQSMVTQENSLFRLTNFVEMTAVFMDRSSVINFCSLYKKHKKNIISYGLDFIISSSCYTKNNPFYILDFISILNPHDELKTNGNREIEKLDSYHLSFDKWFKLRHNFAINNGNQVKVWNRNGSSSDPQVNS